jgi:hypothetical protein
VCAFNEIHLLFKEKISYALNGTTRKLSFSYDNICKEANLISLLMVKKKKKKPLVTKNTFCYEIYIYFFLLVDIGDVMLSCLGYCYWALNCTLGLVS